MKKSEEQKIKAFISRYVFPDGRCGNPDQTILRQVIFDTKNKINWVQALKITVTNMPELVFKDEFKEDLIKYVKNF